MLGDEISLDEYNAYQYLLYKSKKGFERIIMDMAQWYDGGSASYLLNESSLLLNDKAGTYKIKTDLNANSKLILSLNNKSDFLKWDHMDFTCIIYYKTGLMVETESDETIEVQASDNPEIKYLTTKESHKYPNLEEDFKKLKVKCELSNSSLIIPLWNSETNKPRLKKNHIISKYLDIYITYDKIPYIDIRNGIANEPYEILLDTFDELKNVIENSPKDGTPYIIRLDSNRSPYKFPETLRIKKGQNIEIRGGSGEWLDNSSDPKNVRDGRTILEGSICKRLFIVEAGGMLTLTNLRLRKCNCSETGNYDKGRGGAILVESVRRIEGNPEFGILNCNHCVFSNNYAFNGGAIFCYHAGLFLNDCDFISNYSYNNGGAVYYWARDVKLDFPNLTTENGKKIILAVRITDYMNNPVDEGQMAFYLKSGKKEEYIGIVDVASYTRITETSGLSSVPKTGTVKTTLTEDGLETKFRLILKNNLPVTTTKNNKTVLKAYYDDKFEPVTLETDEHAVVCVFKKSVDGTYIPLRKNESNGKYYLDYDDPQLLKHIVYLDEITGTSSIPTNAIVKTTITDTTNESRFSIILDKEGIPVTIVDKGEIKLKALYDNNFEKVELGSGETATLVVLKKKLDGVALPTRLNQANERYYLDYSDASLLKYLVYDQTIDESLVKKGWATMEYEVPSTNTQRVLEFVAHYKAGATYDDEVAMNMVTVIFPEKYTATFTSKAEGEVGSTLTITVKVTDDRNNIISAPSGVFTIDGVTYNAQHDGENYVLKYKVDEKYDKNKFTVEFDLKESPKYKCAKITQDIILSIPEKGEEENAPTYITGLFLNKMDVQLKSGSKTEYEDKKITSTRVDGWINAGITDLFVRCANYNNAEDRALLETVLEKTKGKNLRVHAVLNTFFNVKGKGMKEKWTNVNPTVTDRRNYITGQIEKILKNTKVNGICFDYCRFQGSTTKKEWNGNVDQSKRNTYITSAIKLFNEKIESINKQIYVSITVMPEENASMDYGQKWKDISPHVDYIMPMMYIGNYQGASNGKNSWVTDMIKFMQNNGVSLEKMVTIIQTYVDDKTLETKIKAGKMSESFRSQDNLNTTIKTIAKKKVKGNCLFREGLIVKSGETIKYPISYTKAMEK